MLMIILLSVRRSIRIIEAVKTIRLARAILIDHFHGIDDSILNP